MVVNRHTDDAWVQRLPSRQVLSPSLLSVSLFRNHESLLRKTQHIKIWWKILVTFLYSRKPVKKIGAFCWLSLAICVVELLICVKFGHGLVLDLFLFLLWTMGDQTFDLNVNSMLIDEILIHFLLLLSFFSLGLYPKPMPSWLVQFWISVGVSLVLFLLIWSWQLHQLVARKKWK